MQGIKRNNHATWYICNVHADTMPVTAAGDDTCPKAVERNRQHAALQFDVEVDDAARVG